MKTHFWEIRYILAYANTTQKNLMERRQTGTMEFDQAQPSWWRPKTLIAHLRARTHTHLLARRKSFRKIFSFRKFSRLEELTSVKNSSHPRLSATTMRRKGALLMVHSAKTLTVPLRASRWLSFLFRYALFSSDTHHTGMANALWIYVGPK